MEGDEKDGRLCPPRDAVDRPREFERVVVVGASAGGLEAFRVLLGQLPADFAAPIFVVWHISAEHTSVLAEILNRSSPLACLSVVDQLAIEPGHIYVASADRHLLVGPGVVSLGQGPRENRFRPSIDVLFRSAAMAYGPRVIGVVLTGMLGDGAAGLAAIGDAGGVTVVQDPEEALYSSMPLHAMRAVEVDYCLGMVEIATLLTRLVREPPTARGGHPTDLEPEARVASGEDARKLELTRFGERTD